MVLHGSFSFLSAGTLLSAVAEPAQFWKFEAKHACGVCTEVASGQNCSRYNVCGLMGPDSMRGKNCVELGLCPDVEGPEILEDFGLRIAMGHGRRQKDAYGTVRLTLISRSATEAGPVAVRGLAPESSIAWDYSGQFRYKWTRNFMHTSLKIITPGQNNTFQVGGRIVNVKIPARGIGVAGVLIGDPCFASNSTREWIGCENAKKLQTGTRLPALLSAFGGSPDIDFWGILGDNFYDRYDNRSQEFFSRISQEAKQKVFVTVPGNHDYWVLGSPGAGSKDDQCGNGHMQFFTQDTEAATNVSPSQAPFDFSVDPAISDASACALPAQSNSQFYTQLGNLGIIAQSGAYSIDSYRAFMQEACAWLGSAPDLQFGVIVGHWDKSDLGAQHEMDVPSFWEQIIQYPGCKEKNAVGALKFFMGHTHCNIPHPHGHNGTGFMVAGQGMGGCGNFGVPVLDTSDGRVRVYYFETETEEKYKAVLSCVSANGFRGCLKHATTWLDHSPYETETLV